jgi:L-seryl-tRNA(Ser) seleniumtransferase
VGKEEIIGVLTAIESWQKIDLTALNKEWSKRVERIAKIVETVVGVKTETFVPEDGNRYPTLTVKWDEAAWNFSVADCDKALRAGEPRIEVLTNSNPSMVPAVEEGWQGGRKMKAQPKPEANQLQIVSMTLQDGDEWIVGKRLREILSDAGKNVRA